VIMDGIRQLEDEKLLLLEGGWMRMRKKLQE
jgi:hypothetical protein